MKICNKCGEELPNETIYCEKCGVKATNNDKPAVRAYNKLSQYFNEKKNTNSNEKKYEYKNGVAITLLVLAWIIIIVGFIAGIIMANTIPTTSGEFNYTIMFTYWTICGLSTTMLFVFAEVIQILHDIREKLYTK